MSHSAHRPYRIAITADLHMGSRHSRGMQATLELADYLHEHPPDLLLLAGDIGTGDEFAKCLALFQGLDCQKAVVPGNHDIWVRSDDTRGNSLDVYQHFLPQLAQELGFHYLDQGPLFLEEAGFAIVGSMNWYDYSWALDRLQALIPDWAYRLESKRFSRGKHNDANFVRWPLTDVTFTEMAVSTFAQHLEIALSQMSHAIVVTHHPPFRTLNFPAPEPLNLDDLMWQAFSGNTRMEQALRSRAERIPFAFCGHTHYAVEGNWGPIRGYNIGGDYDYKRLLILDTATGTVKAREFHAPSMDPSTNLEG